MLIHPMKEMERLGRMRRRCRHGACSTYRYSDVVVLVMQSIDKHIVVTSTDRTTDIAGKGNARTCLSNDVTNNIL